MGSLRMHKKDPEASGLLVVDPRGAVEHQFELFRTRGKEVQNRAVVVARS
jgi:hypothetical protein